MLLSKFSLNLVKPCRYLDSNTSVSYSLLQPVGSIHYPPGADPFFVPPPPPPLAEVGPNLMESWPLVGGMEAGGVELAGSADLGRQMLQAPPPYVALPLSQAEGEGMEGLEGMGEMEEGPESEEESESGDGEDPAAQLYYCTSDAAAFGALKAGLAMPGQAVNQSEEEERPPRPPPTKRKSVYKTWSGVTRGAGTGSGKRKPRRRTPTQVQLPLGPPCPMEPSITTQAQRKAANVRERKRMYNLNAAFDYLRSAVPKFAYEKHLSRIETLKLAMHYICFMEELLQTPAEAAQAKYANAANEMIVKWNANVN